MLKDSNKIAIIAGERNITYSELLQRVFIYSQFSPQEKGEKTLIFADNCAGWIFAFRCACGCIFHSE